jgi:hypothetical protein
MDVHGRRAFAASGDMATKPGAGYDLTSRLGHKDVKHARADGERSAL